MQRTSSRLRTGFLVLFLLGAAAVAAQQVSVVRAERRCIEVGGWWSRDERTCTETEYTGAVRRPGGATRPAIQPEA